MSGQGMAIAAARAKATQLLTHYLATVWQRAGLRWDSDNQAEVTEIVDLIFDAIDDSASHVQEQLDSPDWRDRR